VDANVSATRSRSPSGAIGGTTAGSVITNRSASAGAAWEADLWGRLRRTVESSEAGAQAGAADLAAARLSAQSELASNYFQLRVLDAGKRLLDETAAAYARTLELTRNRYSAGVVPKVDVVQAETQLKSTRAQAIDIGVQRAQLENAIAVLVGKPGASLRRVGSLPTPRAGAAAFAGDGAVYLIGGEHAGSTPSDEILRFDLRTHRISSAGRFIEPLAGRAEPVRPGLSKMGAIHIYTREVASHIVTVVGEAPATSVQRVAQAVEFRKPQ